MQKKQIRKIVLFTHGIETLWFFSLQLGKALEGFGYEVFYFDQCYTYDSLSRLLAFCQPRVTAAVSFNFDGCKGKTIWWMQTGSIFLRRGRSLLSIL